jgi:hypothetical protein
VSFSGDAYAPTVDNTEATTLLRMTPLNRALLKARPSIASPSVFYDSFYTAG